MNTEELSLGGSGISRCILAEGERIDSASAFLDLLASCASDTLALDSEAFDPAFFDLKSGLAGEILQKVSNYRKRLVVLGDFTAVRSRALAAFIYESNRAGQVVFAADFPEAVRMLR